MRERRPIVALSMLSLSMLSSKDLVFRGEIIEENEVKDLLSRGAVETRFGDIHHHQALEKYFGMKIPTFKDHFIRLKNGDVVLCVAFDTFTKTYLFAEVKIFRRTEKRSPQQWSLPLASNSG